MDISGQKTCKCAQITDVGCVRELNEDSLHCGQNLWLIADGMGGHACGEVASQLAAHTIATEFAKSGILADAIQNAHHKIIEAAKQNVSQSGMGTTVVALAGSPDGYEIAWVGDSRAYLWDSKRNRLVQLTEDHSLIVRLVNSGLISVEDAKTHPQRHMITQCLGSIEIENVQVGTYKGRWQPCQQVFLCSDGLSDDVSEKEIALILSQDTSDEEKLARLLDAAKQKGGKDNISMILINSPLVAKQSLWEKLKSVITG